MSIKHKNKTSKSISNKKGYGITHIGTERYRCKRQLNRKTNRLLYPIDSKGNYESLLSFKDLPNSNKLKSRKWKFTKN